MIPVKDPPAEYLLDDFVSAAEKMVTVTDEPTASPTTGKPTETIVDVVSIDNVPKEDFDLDDTPSEEIAIVQREAADSPTPSPTSKLDNEVDAGSSASADVPSYEESEDFNIDDTPPEVDVIVDERDPNGGSDNDQDSTAEETDEDENSSGDDNDVADSPTKAPTQSTSATDDSTEDSSNSGGELLMDDDQLLSGESNSTSTNCGPSGFLRNLITGFLPF